MKIFHLAVWLMLAGQLSAQQFGFQNFSVADGLAQSQVFAMCMDHHGYLWLGTRGGGVSRFDGQEFTSFTTRNQLINNYIWSLHEDSNGNLLIGTDNGLSIWNGRAFSNFPISDSQAVAVYSIVENESGPALLGTSMGLFALEEDSLYAVLPENEMLKAEITDLLSSPEGGLWIGQRGRICYLQGDSLTIYSQEVGIPATKQIWGMALGPDSSLWIASYGEGILKWDGDKFRPQLQRGNLYRGLVFDLMFDGEERLWLATQNHGVARWNQAAQQLDWFSQEMVYRHLMPVRCWKTIGGMCGLELLEEG